MQGYTVIDLETTGFSPQKGDRIVEIGVVYVSPMGEIQNGWSTLVNPQRDVGPTHVHGLTASDVIGAPIFADIAPYVLQSISGRTVAAHNAAFDLRFLTHELQRAGVPLAQLPLPSICTMTWSTHFVSSPSRRLSDVCNACGLEITHAHSAGGDAMATAQLLSHYLRAARFEPPWHDELTWADSYAWPTFTGQYPPWRGTPREQVRARPAGSWLDRLVARMPRANIPEVDTYLHVLEMALLDGFLSEHEKNQLVAVAEESGLTRDQMLRVHAQYLQALARIALDDGVVTETERRDLGRVAGLLGLGSDGVDRALTQARALRDPALATTALTMTSLLSLDAGDRVVFTGDMRRPRDEWEELVHRRGLTTGSITRKTKVLVAADPNSLSGKAAKARDYGIPIITEDAFERLLGE